MSAEDWVPRLQEYEKGSLVKYQGTVYAARETHCPLFSWEPPSNPSLWKPLDSDSLNSSRSNSQKDDESPPLTPTSENGDSL
ncbi:hypothetical protein HDV00_000532 [Rhizophlyctis rosea]|nr:hypothetical protein HDV00_000532 [Rhizophlyctis rosea]